MYEQENGIDNPTDQNSDGSAGDLVGVESADNTKSNLSTDKVIENSQKADKPWLWKKGQSGNPGGRPKGGLKDYDRKKFVEMTDEQKEEFLKKIAPELRYRMAEGNPHQTAEVKGNLTVNIVKEIAEQNDINIDENETNLG